MKKSLKLPFFVLLMAIVITGCDKDEKSESSIVGIWQLMSLSSLYDDGSTDFSNDQIYYEFKKNGTCSGNVEFMDVMPAIGDWSIKNGTLTISDIKFKIARLNDNQLIIRKYWGNPDSPDYDYLEIVFNKAEDITDL
jgi:hypothetical protein